MQLTEWFDGFKFTPCNVGVYEVEAPDGIKSYQYWNGEFWGFMADTPKTAFEGGKGCVSHYQNLPFRGIKK